MRVQCPEGTITKARINRDERKNEDDDGSGSFDIPQASCGESKAISSAGNSNAALCCLTDKIAAPDTFLSKAKSMRVQCPEGTITKARSEYRAFVIGAPSGTRTLDPLIKSQLLYQLS